MLAILFLTIYLSAKCTAAKGDVALKEDGFRRTARVEVNRDDIPGVVDTKVRFTDVLKNLKIQLFKNPDQDGHRRGEMSLSVNGINTNPCDNCDSLVNAIGCFYGGKAPTCICRRDYTGPTCNQPKNPGKSQQGSSNLP